MPSVRELTLSGDISNASMGANTFASKQEIYRNSSIGMTRRLAEENAWNEATLERRAEDIARRALDRWPWSDHGTQADANWSDGASVTERFWRIFKEITGGVPGQKETWRHRNLWTKPCNSSGDCIGIYVGIEYEVAWLYVLAGDQQSANKTVRSRKLSRLICDSMSGQEISGDLEKESESGRTVCVKRHWPTDDEDEWPETARWIKAQYDRLQGILANSSIE